MLNIWKQAWSKSEVDSDSQYSPPSPEGYTSSLTESTPAYDADNELNSIGGQSRKRAAKNISCPRPSENASRGAKRRKLFNNDLSNPHSQDITHTIYPLKDGVRELEPPDDMPPLQMSSVERVAVYDPMPHAEETNLFKSLLGIDKDQRTYANLFRRATHVLQELGPCASDLVWRNILKDLENNAQNKQVKEDAEIELKVNDLIVNWTFHMPNTNSVSRGFNVSPKLAKLIELLSAYRVTKDSFQGIVYGMFLVSWSCLIPNLIHTPVKKRSTALAIADIVRFSRCGDFLRPEVLCGHSNHLSSSSQV